MTTQKTLRVKNAHSKRVWTISKRTEVITTGLKKCLIRFVVHVAVGKVGVVDEDGKTKVVIF